MLSKGHTSTCPEVFALAVCKFTVLFTHVTGSVAQESPNCPSFRDACFDHPDEIVFPLTLPVPPCVTVLFLVSSECPALPQVSLVCLLIVFLHDSLNESSLKMRAFPKAPRILKAVAVSIFGRNVQLLGVVTC